MAGREASICARLPFLMGFIHRRRKERRDIIFFICR
jgi:hypothetical protein